MTAGPSFTQKPTLSRRNQGSSEVPERSLICWASPSRRYRDWRSVCRRRPSPPTHNSAFRDLQTPLHPMKMRGRKTHLRLHTASCQAPSTCLSWGPRPRTRAHTGGYSRCPPSLRRHNTHTIPVQLMKLRRPDILAHRSRFMLVLDGHFLRIRNAGKRVCAAQDDPVICRHRSRKIIFSILLPAYKRVCPLQNPRLIIF